MKMFRIETSAPIPFGLGDDAVEAFRRSVTNGQARLAIEILVDIVDALVEKIDELESRLEPPSVIQTEETPVAIEYKKENKPQPKIDAKPKSAQQKEVIETESE